MNFRERMRNNYTVIYSDTLRVELRIPPTGGGCRDQTRVCVNHIETHAYVSPKFAAARTYRQSRPFRAVLPTVSRELARSYRQCRRDSRDLTDRSHERNISRPTCSPFLLLSFIHFVLSQDFTTVEFIIRSRAVTRANFTASFFNRVVPRRSAQNPREDGRGASRQKPNRDFYSKTPARRAYRSSKPLLPRCNGCN